MRVWAAAMVWGALVGPPQRIAASQTGLKPGPETVASAPPPVKVNARQLVVDQIRRVALYSGNVRATRGTAVVTCDVLEAFLGPDNAILRFEANGHVVAEDGERRARGEKADFDQVAGILVVTGQPVLAVGQREVAGERLVWNKATNVLQMSAPRGLARTAAGTTDGTLSAEHLTVRQDDGQAEWVGKVKAVRGTLVVTAPRMGATYAPDGTLKRLVGEGGVELQDADKWARGERGDYDASREVLVVTGRPEARQAGNSLKGSRITWYRARELMEVDDAVSVLESGALDGRADGGTKAGR